jgi:hypothetical protein
MKKFYVTKKQVDEYIENRNVLYDSINLFIVNLISFLSDLEENPEYNKNQIKFFGRVLERIYQNKTS